MSMQTNIPAHTFGKNFDEVVDQKLNGFYPNDKLHELQHELGLSVFENQDELEIACQNITISPTCNPSRQMSLAISFVGSRVFEFACLFFVLLNISTVDGYFQSYIDNKWSFILYIVLIVAYVWMSLLVRNDPGYLKSRIGPQPKPANAGVRPGPNDWNPPPLNYCDRCEIVQPRRTRHCKRCDICVATFDHHCFFIGGCVGEFNRGRFVVFLCIACVVLSWNVALTANAIVAETLVSNWFGRNFLSILLTCLLSLCLLCVVMKLAVQIYLVCTNQTTWEWMARSKISYLTSLPGAIHPFATSHGENARRLMKLKRKEQDSVERWRFTVNGPNDAIPFNYFENDHYDCGC